MPVADRVPLTGREALQSSADYVLPGGVLHLMQTPADLTRWLAFLLDHYRSRSYTTTQAIGAGLAGAAVLGRTAPFVAMLVGLGTAVTATLIYRARPRSDMYVDREHVATVNCVWNELCVKNRTRRTLGETAVPGWIEYRSDVDRALDAACTEMRLIRVRRESEAAPLL